MSATVFTIMLCSRTAPERMQSIFQKDSVIRGILLEGNWPHALCKHLAFRCEDVVRSYAGCLHKNSRNQVDLDYRGNDGNIPVISQEYTEADDSRGGRVLSKSF